MGKASRWIRNFLLMGKKEDSNKYKEITSKTSELGSPAILTADNPNKVKRRWSFKRKSTDAKPTMHRFTRSFDSIFFVPKQAAPLHQHAAATKIQAAYRSYLARRALRALKALVKLQALARGHLVRKQMNTVVRSMHAVIAIQVRARINRFRNAEQPRRLSCTAAEKGRGEDDRFLNGTSLRSRMSLSQRENRLKMPPSPSMSQTDSSSASYDYAAWRQNPIARYSQNYMSNTESSKAKAKERSHSAPKQRPEERPKRKGRQSLSMDGENGYPLLDRKHRPSDEKYEDLDANANDTRLMSPFEPPVIFF